MTHNYFEEQINNNQPIMPPDEVKEDKKPVENVPATSPNEFRGLPVRAGGDRIWLIRAGKKAWITSAEVYEKLGFKFGDEKDIDRESLEVFPEDDPIR